MMPTKAKSKGAELVELQAEVRGAEIRVRELSNAARRSRTAVDAAEQELHQHVESAIEQGKEPDPKQLAKLRKAIRDAGDNLSLRPDVLQGQVVGMVAVDVEAEARVAGAKSALEDRKREVSAFIAEHRVELCAERLERATEIGSTYVTALRSLRDADAAWSREISYLVNVLDVKIEDVPGRPVPLRELGQELADFELLGDADLLPSPRWLTEVES